MSDSEQNEPCVCGCPGAQYDGHACEDYEPHRPQRAAARGRAMERSEEVADRLYAALAVFDTRDGTPQAHIARSAREGYEREVIGEDQAWAEFDSRIALWAKPEQRKSRYPMVGSLKRGLQTYLVEVFERYGLVVSVGITHEGVAIRSQDKRVDASNIGPVKAR